MYTLPSLPYAYNALEPHFDATTMQLHHQKHHQAYLDKLNAALASHPDLAAQPIETLLAQLKTLPQDLQPAIRNHGGGYANHNLFWTLLTPKAQPAPPSNTPLLSAITTAFRSFDTFKDQFSSIALNHFGSGWAWLVADPATHQLQTYSLPNQDSPLSLGHQPLLALDVWEHAYYLKYQNRRADYIQTFFSLINWDTINQHFNAIIAKTA